MSPPTSRPLQHFSDEYLERCKSMSADEIVEYLEGFRQLHEPPRAPSKLISIKIRPELLEAFRERCRLEGTRYQTQIKRLMSEWLGG